MSEDTKPETTTELKPSEDKKPEIAPVKANESGQLMGTTLDEQWRMACAFLKSGMLPKSYKTAEQVLVGMQFAYELGLKPLMAMRQIAVINGQPSLWGELPLALVRRSGELLHFREWLVDKDYKEISYENKNLDAPVYAALCEIQRKGFEKRTYSFTQKDKHSMGIAAIWTSFEKIMMKRKARTLGLKDQFADIIEGVCIAEYDHHAWVPEEGAEMTVLDKQGQKLKSFGDKFNKPTESVEVVDEQK